LKAQRDLERKLQKENQNKINEQKVKERAAKVLTSAYDGKRTVHEEKEYKEMKRKEALARVQNEINK
jgi:co-chaperonin GroES (HSP10)